MSLVVNSKKLNSPLTSFSFSLILTLSEVTRASTEVSLLSAMDFFFSAAAISDSLSLRREG